MLSPEARVTEDSLLHEVRVYDTSVSFTHGKIKERSCPKCPGSIILKNPEPHGRHSMEGGGKDEPTCTRPVVASGSAGFGRSDRQLAPDKLSEAVARHARR